MTAPTTKTKRPKRNKFPKRRTRPSKITPELITKIAGAIEAGMFPDNAMMGLGVARASVTEWKSKGRAGIAPYSDLLLAIEQAEARSFNRAEKQLGKLIAKGNERAIFWFLERRNRANYKPVHHTEVSGPNGAPLEVQSLQGMATTDLMKLASNDDEDSTDDT